MAKRRRVMQRSQKLGHCICDPRRPCPCDVFIDQGICPCAGERPEPPKGPVKLTEHVHNAGCASKIPAAELEAVLSRLEVVDDQAVLRGVASGDDAGVYDIGNGTLLVQTLDVFTPCVDDPHTFGRVCAANCLSDIYAMGGVPRTALSVMGFPTERLDGDIMHQMLSGAMETLSQAGVALIGGHSIKDEEIKLGFAITGTIDRETILANDAAQVGDVLVLTKPLGAGVLNFCRQIGRQVNMGPVEESMCELNFAAAEAARSVGISACTDVTGFGLFGHLVSMVRSSCVTAQIFADRLPAFEGAVEALADGVVPGAIERNSEFVAEDISVAADVDESLVHLGFDAQTSGGLLLSVPAGRHESLVKALTEKGVRADTIGKIVEVSDGKIAVTLAGQDASIAPAREIVDTPGGPVHQAKSNAGETSQPCCAGVGDSQSPASGSSAAESAKAFGALVRASGSTGLIDEKTKELINFSLVVLSRCTPCIEAHYSKALSMGITPEELDEAAWCATAMGGAPVYMFYRTELEKIKKSGGNNKNCC